MRRFLPALLPALAFSLLLCASRADAQATTPQFFFQSVGTTPTSYTQNLNTLSVAALQTFTFSVWYQYQPASSITGLGLNVFVGYDQTTSSGDSATPTNGYLTANSSNPSSAINNVNPLLLKVSTGLGGGQDPSDSPTPSSAVRPYGLDVSLFDNGGFAFSTGSTPVHLFDVTLTNANLGAGGNQNVVIYSNDPASTSSSYTTYVLTSNGVGGFNQISPASSTILNVVQAGSAATPEPSSLALLLASGAATAIRLRRKRRIA